MSSMVFFFFFFMFYFFFSHVSLSLPGVCFLFFVVVIYRLLQKGCWGEGVGVMFFLEEGTG